LPDPAEENLQVAIRLDGADATFHVDATDEEGRPRDLLETEVRLVGPDLAAETVSLEQTAAGRYEGSTAISEPGTYLVHVVQRDDRGDPVAQQTTGLVVPYSPEYRRTGGGQTLLDELARATGGEVALAQPQAAFAPMEQPVRRARPLWPALLLMAALLFPVDVAVRRLRLTRADWQQLLAWIQGRRPWPAARARRAEPAVLSELFQARDRAQRRSMRATGEPSADSPVVATPSRSYQTPARRSEPSHDERKRKTEPSDEDALARLRKARDRARRRQ
ncbi:MAG: hypothetical protein ACP5KN_21135, partial [Armatimonadota bacterium]